MEAFCFPDPISKMQNLEKVIERFPDTPLAERANEKLLESKAQLQKGFTGAADALPLVTDDIQSRPIIVTDSAPEMRSDTPMAMPEKPANRFVAYILIALGGVMALFTAVFLARRTRHAQ